MRLKMVESGITDPMALPSMHILLDATESAVLEALANSTEKDASFKRSQFLDKLYSPMSDTSGINGSQYEATPGGFHSDEVEASFDAFAAAAGPAG